MAQRRIRIGETSSFRYIGVEPPIENDQAEIIHRAIESAKWFPFGTRWHQNQEQVDDSPIFTEFSLNVEYGNGDEMVNKIMVRIAHQIAQVLELQGDETVVIDHVIPIDFQTPLFGSDADQMYKTHEHFESIRDIE